MAIPYIFIELVGLLLCAGLAFAWWRAPALTRARGAEWEPVALAERTRRLRTTIAAVFALLALLAAGLTWAGMPLAPNAEPIAWGNEWSGGDPRFLAYRGSYDPFIDTPPGQMIFAYAPDAELRAGITLVNNGPAPLTVSGIEPTQGPNVRSLTLRLPPEPLPSDLLPLYPNEGSSIWISEPFHPFTIPAHTQVGLALAVTLGTCPGAEPQPTRAPGATLLPDTDPRLNGGFGVVDTLRLDYTALGIARTASLRMPFAIVAATGQSGFGCPAG